MIRTVLEQLEGCPDVSIPAPVSPLIDGEINGVNRHLAWRNEVDGDERAGNDLSETVQNETPTHFDCVVVGAGQAGLGTAGRLKALGVPHVVLDKHDRIGDNWMTRYDSARLHTAREYNHLPFDRTFPPCYQEFLTKYDLARGYRDWMEKFGIDRHIWFSTTLRSGTWDETQKRWTLQIQRDGAPPSMQILTCRHVVLAVGGGGQIPLMPAYPGRDLYQGTVLHSGDYKTSAQWRGKSGIVIGTANTAHDVAEDMVKAGLSSITMVQRTRTYVLPWEYFQKITHRTYNGDTPVETTDRQQYSMPYAVTRLLSHEALHAMAAEEPERFDALERAGFKVERYGDIMWHICEKLGGHYMNVGCSDLISRGLIQMKSDALPTHFTREGLAFSDGTELAADAVVFCTGFVGNMRSSVRELFGANIADRVQDFWGLDDEGELKGAFKPTGRKLPFSSRWLITLSNQPTRSRALVYGRHDRTRTVLFAPRGDADQG